MIAILLALTLSSAPQPVVVDLVEINHYHDTKGEHVFDQVIFYSWSSQRKRYDVREWMMLKADSHYPRQRGQGYFMRWHHDGDMREAVVKHRRETRTQHDPEMLERKYLEQEQRLPLFRGKAPE